jgi:hypothetical protein
MNLQKQIDFALKISFADKATALRMLDAIYRAQKTAKGQNRVKSAIDTINN